MFSNNQFYFKKKILVLSLCDIMYLLNVKSQVILPPVNVQKNDICCKMYFNKLRWILCLEFKVLYIWSNFTWYIQVCVISHLTLKYLICRHYLSCCLHRDHDIRCWTLYWSSSSVRKFFINFWCSFLLQMFLYVVVCH